MRLIRRPAPSLILGHTGPLGLWPYRLPLQDFDTHLYVVGRTKQGKSKFLQYLVYQLILFGQGCGLLDPHSDLVDDLLAQLAPRLERDPLLHERIVYVQPGRDDGLVPFNVLRVPGEPYAIAQGVLEAFRRAWPETLREAPRFANIVLAALLLLIERHLTLVEMPRLLTDRDYREHLLHRSANGEVVRFFHERYDRWGRERALVIESVLNKVGAFVLNPRLRAVLGAAENRLPFREIMDRGQVLLCDLGRVDDETRRLLGSLIMTGLEGAALARKDLPAESRPPFYFLLDEFQDYCAQEGSAQTLARILAECRKFGLRLGLAHQTLSQIENALLRGALENAGLRVVFGVGRQTARGLVEELFLPDLSAIKHEVTDDVQRERTHPTYFPLAEQWEAYIQRVQRLPRRWALVQLPERPGVHLIRTVTVPPNSATPARLAEVQRALARQAGRPRATLEGEIERRETGQIALEKGTAMRYYEDIDAS